MKREHLVNRYSLFIYNTNYEPIKIFKNNIGTTLAYPKPKKNNLVFTSKKCNMEFDALGFGVCILSGIACFWLFYKCIDWFEKI